MLIHDLDFADWCAERKKAPEGGASGEKLANKNNTTEFQESQGST
jgi:hypothetical protein